MSSSILLSVLLLLALGVWLASVIGIWYGRKLVRFQQDLVRTLLPYLNQMEQEKAIMRDLKVDKDEPLEKYREIVLPNQVHVDFTEEKE